MRFQGVLQYTTFAVDKLINKDENILNSILHILSK